MGYINEVTLPKIRPIPPTGEDNLSGGQTPTKLLQQFKNISKAG